MCNFHTNAQLSKALLDDKAQHLVFKALAPIKKGAQVYLNFGPFDNTQLVLSYKK
jgi:hypothetical protein